MYSNTIKLGSTCLPAFLTTVTRLEANDNNDNNNEALQDYYLMPQQQTHHRGLWGFNKRMSSIFNHLSFSCKTAMY